MTALEELRAVYRARFATPPENPVGYVGADVPPELIEAAGSLPLRLAPVEGVDTTFADRVLGPGVDEAVRAVLAGLLEGAYSVERLVLCTETDHLVRLYATLRRLGGHGLDLWLVDLLHLPRAPTERHDREELVRFGEWLGGGLNLSRAIALSNRVREVGDALARLRRAGVVDGADALAILGAGTALPADRYVELLAASLDELAVNGQPRPTVLMLGSDHCDDALYAAVDACGATVVSETHGWGEALVAGRIADDREPIDALVAHYRPRPRVEPASADVALAWIRDGDESYAWSLPHLRRRLGRDIVIVRDVDEVREALA